MNTNQVNEREIIISVWNVNIYIFYKSEDIYLRVFYIVKKDIL